jgi:hypothetical protein
MRYIIGFAGAIALLTLLSAPAGAQADRLGAGEALSGHVVRGAAVPPIPDDLRTHLGRPGFDALNAAYEWSAQAVVAQRTWTAADHQRLVTLVRQALTTLLAAERAKYTVKTLP